MVIIIGVGLIGSFVAMVLRQKVVLVDPDCYSDHHLAIPCAEAGVKKVKALENYRGSRQIGETIVAIPHRLEQLGETFWRWVVENQAVVVDATDGNRASHTLSKIATGRISVVHAKVGGNTCFVRSFPASAGVGYCCMGFDLRDSTPETSCIRIPVNPEEPAATQASLSVASAVSALIAGSVESISRERRAREIRLDLDAMRWMSSELQARQTCNHRRKPEPEQKIRIHGNSFTLSLADLAQEAAAHLGVEARWKSTMGSVNSLICGDCGHKLSNGSYWFFVGSREYRCSNCGSANMSTVSANMRTSREFTAKDMMKQAISLFESGLPFSEAYCFYSGNGRTIELEVDDHQYLIGEAIDNEQPGI